MKQDTGFWTQLRDSVIAQNGLGLASGPSQQTWLERTFDGLLGGRLVQIIFWAFAGCFVYVCIWFAINIITNLRNDLVADEYIHPADYNRSGYWSSILARKGFFVASLIILIGYIFTSLRLLPLLGQLFLSALQDFQLSPSVGEIIGSIVGVAFLIYLFVLLVHMTVNSWRTIYTDL